MKRHSQLIGYALIYVVYHYSRAKRASAEGGRIQRISSYACK